MNVNQVNSYNYNPQFGNIVVEKGGEKLLKQFVKEGNLENLTKIFKEAENNFAADIFVNENNVGVLDKITGKKYLPTGKLLQQEHSKFALFKEAELLEGSSKQAIPERDAGEGLPYLYLGEKDVSDGGFFSEAKFVDTYFEPQKESSYIIKEQHNNSVGDGYYKNNRLYYTSEDDHIRQVISKFNAALEIARDIKFQAETAINTKSKSASEAINAFVSHLIK